MIDDLKFIHQRDKSDALGVAERQWMQYKHEFTVEWKPEREIHNVVVAGMGGSGLAAKAFRSWPGVDVPFEVVQRYELPEYVQANTLVIVSSYSGNTEETISCIHQALTEDLPLKQRPMLVAISAGGKLEEIAKENNVAHIKLPDGLQPRMTFGYQLRALVQLFEKTPLLGTAAVKNLEQASEWLKAEMAQWKPEIPTKDNEAKQIAKELMGKSVVMYSGPKLAPAAYKWKISFNENAKHVAWWNTIPEFNHNEFLGWTKQPTDKPYAVIDLRSPLEHERVQKRFDVSAKLLSGLRPEPIRVDAKGENILYQLMYLVALGDFVSLYLALLGNIDPTPVDLIEKFKKSLD